MSPERISVLSSDPALAAVLGNPAVDFLAARGKTLSLSHREGAAGEACFRNKSASRLPTNIGSVKLPLEKTEGFVSGFHSGIRSDTTRPYHLYPPFRGDGVTYGDDGRVFVSVYTPIQMLLIYKGTPQTACGIGQSEVKAREENQSRPKVSASRWATFEYGR